MRSQAFTTMIRSALLCCLFGASLACTAHAAVPDAVPENLVIAGDWPAIVRHLTNVKNVDSVTNFIAGHAFLATDHANEAMCSLLLVCPLKRGLHGVDGRPSWQQPTQRLPSHITSRVTPSLATVTGRRLAPNLTMRLHWRQTIHWYSMPALSQKPVQAIGQ